MNLSETFKRIGLGKNSALVYSTILENKNGLLAAHISKLAQIDRPEVYRNLTSLLKKGFIKKIRIGKRFHYSTTNPEIIQQAFQNTDKKVETLTENIQKKKLRSVPDHVTYFKGPAGIRAVFDDVIDRMPKGGTFFRYTSERDLEEVNRYLSPDYRLRRDKKKLERLVISNPISGKAKKSRLERFIRFIPPEKDLFDQNIIQLVYADSVAFINLNAKDAFIIRDKDLARFQAVIFNLLYKKLDY